MWLYLWRPSLTVVLLNGFCKYSAMILRKMKLQVITILDPSFLKIPHQTQQKRANISGYPKARPIILPNNVYMNIYLHVEFESFFSYSYFICVDFYCNVVIFTLELEFCLSLCSWHSQKLEKRETQWTKPVSLSALIFSSWNICKSLLNEWEEAEIVASSGLPCSEDAQRST